MARSSLPRPSPPLPLRLRGSPSARPDAAAATPPHHTNTTTNNNHTNNNNSDQAHPPTSPSTPATRTPLKSLSLSLGLGLGGASPPDWTTTNVPSLNLSSVKRGQGLVHRPKSKTDGAGLGLGLGVGLGAGMGACQGMGAGAGAGAVDGTHFSHSPSLRFLNSDDDNHHDQENDVTASTHHISLALALGLSPAADLFSPTSKRKGRGKRAGR
jgi:hypothetical protein